MNSYFIGQRVRIVRSDFRAELVGTEATIVGPLEKYHGLGGEWLGVPVQPDLWGSPVLNEGGRKIRFAPKLVDLEPVTYEGMQPAKWEDCLWQPPKVEVRW